MPSSFRTQGHLMLEATAVVLFLGVAGAMVTVAATTLVKLPFVLQVLIAAGVVAGAITGIVTLVVRAGRGVGLVRENIKEAMRDVVKEDVGELQQTVERIDRSLIFPSGESLPSALIRLHQRIDDHLESHPQRDIEKD